MEYDVLHAPRRRMFMRHLVLNLLAAFVVAGQTFASTIVTVVCSIPTTTQTQTGAASASCDASQTFPSANAIANGTASLWSLSGSVAANYNELAYASSDSSFTASFSVPTILTWDLGADVGPFGYAYFDLGGVTVNCQYLDPPACYPPIVETLLPGTYTFSMDVYNSEEGGAMFTVA
jgi:hypothetical protein